MEEKFEFTCSACGSELSVAESSVCYAGGKRAEKLRVAPCGRCCSKAESQRNAELESKNRWLKRKLLDAGILTWDDDATPEEREQAVAEAESSAGSEPAAEDGGPADPPAAPTGPWVDD